jgi:hypothetical protein
MRLKEDPRRIGLGPATFPFERGRRPYPGFAALEEKDAAIFFGRDAQIVRGLDKLRGLARNGVDRMLVILGASGAGKSSFLRSCFCSASANGASAAICCSACARPNLPEMTARLGRITGSGNQVLSSRLSRGHSPALRRRGERQHGEIRRS